ncbi:hypothetical protein K458DRAFT_402613 [Lentithecium fluviatile CBS 122367]|uniref:Uncharacterized protein n=1 Tax=Lentithecium fluviatile CBS 122367 TaxID=1168545 RepID=A0A6G1J7I2_9PLEO|nr:hypothetical protein K458DRAFT_402613 [Lentithecium fluviatile CBS 122367]
MLYQAAVTLGIIENKAFHQLRQHLTSTPRFRLLEYKELNEIVGHIEPDDRVFGAVAQDLWYRWSKQRIPDIEDFKRYLDSKTELKADINKIELEKRAERRAQRETR